MTNRIVYDFQFEEAVKNGTVTFQWSDAGPFTLVYQDSIYRAGMESGKKKTMENVMLDYLKGYMKTTSNQFTNFDGIIICKKEALDKYIDELVETGLKRINELKKELKKAKK